MIVRYESDGSIVMITQNDHAQLSGLFAAHWGNEKFEKPRPYASLVRAAMFHDRGWIRYETSPQLNLETGKTPNYREVPNDQTQLEAFEWAGDWLSGIDPYAGLMIAKHRTGLWQGRYGVITHPPAIQRGTLPPAIQEFIATSEAKQKAAADKFDAKEFAINYNLLQVWDIISLYICSTEVLKPDRIEPVPVVLFGRGGRRHDADAGRSQDDRARSLPVRSAVADDQRDLPPAAADQVQGPAPSCKRSISGPRRRSRHSGWCRPARALALHTIRHEHLVDRHRPGRHALLVGVADRGLDDLAVRLAEAVGPRIGTEQLALVLPVRGEPRQRHDAHVRHALIGELLRLLEGAAQHHRHPGIALDDLLLDRGDMHDREDAGVLEIGPLPLDIVREQPRDPLVAVENGFGVCGVISAGSSPSSSIDTADLPRGTRSILSHDGGVNGASSSRSTTQVCSRNGTPWCSCRMPLIQTLLAG